MDWMRYLRAVEAGQIERVEQRRREFIEGRLGEEKISDREWAQIREHDRLVAGDEPDDD